MQNRSLDDRREAKRRLREPKTTGGRGALVMLLLAIIVAEAIYIAAVTL